MFRMISIDGPESTVKRHRKMGIAGSHLRLWFLSPLGCPMQAHGNSRTKDHQSGMMHFVFVVSFPWALRCDDTYGVDIGSHGVLNVRWHIQETPRGVSLRSRLIEFRSNRDFECSGNYGNSGILIVKVVLPMTCRKEESIRERFTRCIFVAF